MTSQAINVTDPNGKSYNKETPNPNRDRWEQNTHR